MKPEHIAIPCETIPAHAVWAGDGPPPPPVEVKPTDVIEAAAPDTFDAAIAAVKAALREAP